jgi:tetraacyldisaccharide 4'-kinase
VSRRAHRESKVTALWYTQQASAWLAPFEWIYRAAIACRRLAYRLNVFAAIRVERPVVVVGNLTVGGTGKTPLVIYLVEQLQRRGYRVAVISRGFAGDARGVVPVTSRSDPGYVGDEPVLIASRTRCSVFVGRARVAAARAAVAEGADIIVSDDGLQHYALARDFEIAVIDGARGFGNGALLPRGPLREPIDRLRSIDQAVINGEQALRLPAGVNALTMLLSAGDAYSVQGHGLARSLASFAGTPVHAVAAIGNPDRFFAMLKRSGLELREHPFPDHHAFAASDLEFGDSLPILMTEKDAVKCRAFAHDRMWHVPVSAVLRGDILVDRIVATVNGRQSRANRARG